jgi:hypothetical protein
MAADPSRLRPTTRARLAAAATGTACHHQLSTFAALQPAPPRPNMLQSVPPRAPAQNEPKTEFLPPDLWQEVLREFNAIKSAAEADPANLLQVAPTCSNAPPESRRRKTNPEVPPSTPHLPTPSSRRRPRPLTPTQLRAARLWSDGHSHAAILQALAISRHTLARWKRHPDFQAELRRLSDAQCAANSTGA